jgi:hypothetical protein
MKSELLPLVIIIPLSGFALPLKSGFIMISGMRAPEYGLGIVGDSPILLMAALRLENLSAFDVGRTSGGAFTEADSLDVSFA